MNLVELNPVIKRVTERIKERSLPTRKAYLAGIDAILARKPYRDRLGCANLAHAFAATPANDKLRIKVERAPNIGIVTAYNDMLSAHQPYESFPEIIRDEARKRGATAQVAGGVPAMCDGITQGTPAMELSLFSRDTIAMATAVSLSHDVFDAAVLMGVCDKIVPGLLIGALHFGHLPCVFIPAGPMGSGISNSAKAKVREQFAQGLVTREALMASEEAAYHSPGTCTFYGTANSNQMLLEAMGLHIPGAAFVQPGTTEREVLTRQAVATAVDIARNRFTPIGRMVDERTIVNAMVALLATGGSTNHLIHWVAVAKAAGIAIDWDDFDDLSHAVPLLARMYPNGDADVNQFQAAGGVQYVLRELLDAGLMHADAGSINAPGLRSACDGAPAMSSDTTVLRPASAPFSEHGGLRLLKGNMGRAVIKTSAVLPDRLIIEAPTRVFDSQGDVIAAFERGELVGDVIAVVRFQGPQANGMPELHKLMPVLSTLQGRGAKVALVTDGRLSGASGKVPAALHVWPEAASGGVLARLRDGDVIRLDATSGTLQVKLSEAELATRALATNTHHADNQTGLGRELFTAMRRYSSHAEAGATTW
jgi:phosphogluconate dehydratase